VVDEAEAGGASGGPRVLRVYSALDPNETKIYFSEYEKYTKEQQTRPVKAGTKYSAPEGHDEHFEHFKNFFEGVRTGNPVVEDPVFGFRACAPCLACNDSYFQKKIINWDPVNMKLV